MRREVAAQIAMLRNREEFLNRQIGELQQKNRELPTLELPLQRLQREAKTNDDLLALLKTKHQEALIKEAEQIEEVSIVRPATEPDSPIGGETANTMLVGAVLGLALGLVLAFVRETLDTSIGTIEDVEAYLGVPVLGVVPHIDSRETVQRILERRPALATIDPEALLSHSLLITHFDPKSPVAEAYRHPPHEHPVRAHGTLGQGPRRLEPDLARGQDHDDREPRAHDGAERPEDPADRREHAAAEHPPVLRDRARARALEHPGRQRAVARLHPDGRGHPHGAVRDGGHHGRPGPRQPPHHRGRSGAREPVGAPVDSGDDGIPALGARRVRRGPRRHAADPAGHRLGDRRLAGRRRGPRLSGGQGRTARAQAREGPRRERRRQGLGRGPERREDRDRGLRVHAVLHALLRRRDGRRSAQGALCSAWATSCATSCTAGPRRGRRGRRSRTRRVEPGGRFARSLRSRPRPPSSRPISTCRPSGCSARRNRSASDGRGRRRAARGARRTRRLASGLVRGLATAEGDLAPAPRIAGSRPDQALPAPRAVTPPPAPRRFRHPSPRRRR